MGRVASTSPSISSLGVCNRNILVANERIHIFTRNFTRRTGFAFAFNSVRINEIFFTSRAPVVLTTWALVSFGVPLRRIGGITRFALTGGINVSLTRRAILFGAA